MSPFPLIILFFLAMPFSPSSAQTSAQKTTNPLHAVGSKLAVTTSARQSTRAAVWALKQGGNAADAYIAAALAQTVVEPGLTSLAGAFGITFFEAKTGTIRAVVGRLGPAKSEKYDYDRNSPVTRTGRAMPVPGFVAGIHGAHGQFGRLAWEKLFGPAIWFAEKGTTIPAGIIKAARKRGVGQPEGRALWVKKGKFLRPGERFIQADLAGLLRQVAKGGPRAFYTGPFAKRYVARARRDGGVLTMQDMAGWSGLIRNKTCKLEGQYRGHRICAPGAGLLIYALHLSEALDLRNLTTVAERIYCQVRIMEEVFHAAKEYSAKTHTRFISPEYARKRAKFVSTSKPRKVTLDAIFNTSFIVVKDREGNCAWGTHSINTPTAFGAGIVVDGAYCSYAINRKHVKGKGATAPGISTTYALFKKRRPCLIVGSPGYGFVHGPYQFGTAVIELGMDPMAAARAPRFGLPTASTGGRPVVEKNFPKAVFTRLEKGGISCQPIPASGLTGLIGALFVGPKGQTHVVQDPRRGGLSLAE